MSRGSLTAFMGASGSGKMLASPELLEPAFLLAARQITTRTISQIGMIAVSLPCLGTFFTMVAPTR